VLRQAGVQADDANQISRALKKNEQSLSHEQLKQIDSFQGIMDVLANPEHHHH
jgi:acid phosphatase family membrane protein YuiD